MEMFTLPQLLILLTAVAGSGTMVGVMAWVYMRIRRLESGFGVAELRQLREQVELLQGELRETRGDIGELREHAEFNAKLLMNRPDGE